MYSHRHEEQKHMIHTRHHQVHVLKSVTQFLREHRARTFYIPISTSPMLLVSSLKGQKMLHIHHESSSVPDRAMWFTGTYVSTLQVTETCTKRFRRYQIPSLGRVPLNGSQKLKVLTRHSGHHLKNVNFKGFNPEKSKQNSVNMVTSGDLHCVMCITANTSAAAQALLVKVNCWINCSHNHHHYFHLCQHFHVGILCFLMRN